MKTPGQNLLALLVGRPATKVAYTVLGEGGGEFDSEGRRMSYGRNSASQVPVASYRPQLSFRSTGNPRSAYTVLGQGGGEYDSDGRSLTQSGYRWGQGRVSMGDLQDAQYRQDSRNRMNAMIAEREQHQSAGRQRLSEQWVTRQGYGSRDPFGLRSRQKPQQQGGWAQQNAALLKRYPQLQQYASYFEKNPQAWQKFQADAGLTPAAPMPRTPVQTPKPPQTAVPVAQKQQQGQQPSQTPASRPAPVPPQPQTPQTDGSPQDPVRQQVEAARAAGPKIGLTYAEYQERLRKMRTPAWRQPQVPGPTAEPPKAPGFQVHPPQMAGAAVTTKAPVAATRMPEPQLKPLLNRTPAQQTSVAAPTTPKIPVAPAAPATVAAKPPPTSAVAGTPLLNQKFTAFGGSNSGVFAGTPTVAKPTPSLPAAKPTVATWSPGQNLPGMTRAQTQAYQGKLPKIAEVLVRSLTKRAQAYDAVRNAGIVTDQVEPNKWQASVDAMVADQERQREEAMKPAPEPALQLTPEESWDRYAAQMPIVQKKDTATTMREHEGYKSWGDRLVSGQMAREEGTSTGAILRNGFKDFAEDWAHDTLNNWNIYANNIQRGAGDVGRFVAKWVDPRSWGSSTRAKLNRQSHDNDWDNARAATAEKDRRILDSMNTGLGSRELAGGKGVSTADKWLSRLNYGTSAGVGQFVGGELATAGMGTVAKGLGRGIQYGAKAVGSGAGNAVMRGANWLGNTKAMKGVQKVTDPLAEKYRYVRSGFGQRAQNLERSRLSGIDFYNRNHAPIPSQLSTPQAYRQAYAKGLGRASPISRRDMWSGIAGHELPLSVPERLGSVVSRGIGEMGNVIASPFTTAGQMATPIQSTAKGLEHVANGVVQTGRAALQPAGTLLRTIRHPMQTARTAGQFALQHPVKATWNTATYPVRYGYNVLKPAGKAYLHPESIRLQTAVGAGQDIHDGNYGSAAEGIGLQGAFGAFGNKAMLGMLPYQYWRATSSDGEDYGEY